MTKLILAPALALALSAPPAMAQSAQPAASTTIKANTSPLAILIGMLLPAIQKVR